MSRASTSIPVAGLALAIVALAGTSRAGEPGYCFHGLGTFGGQGSWGHDINDADPPQMIGEADLTTGRHRGFLYSDWDGYAVLDLETHGIGGLEGALEGCPEPSGCNTTVASINLHGSVIGVGTIPRIHHALTFPPLADIGTLVDNEFAQSFGLGINDLGAAVGRADHDLDGEKIRHGFYFPGSGPLEDLESEDPALTSEATSLNNAGQVVGCRDDRATVWEHDGLEWVATRLTDAFASVAWDINEQGVVVGYARGRATAWRRTAGAWNAAAVDPGPELSIAYGINGSRVIAGSAEIDGQERARLWIPVLGQPGEWTRVDLTADPAVPAGWILTEAREVNDAGWVVGTGFEDVDGDGMQAATEHDRAFVLRAVDDTDTCGAP